MAGSTMHEPTRQIRRLFSEGTVAGLGDPALLGRFASRRDQEAFGALVARHGPMVLGVCRGVLVDPDDAEDAFQATFLALARKAGSIRVEGSVGGWLHRVARRVSVKANARRLRRRSRERPAVEPDQIPGRPGRASDESAAILHEEIDRLPESYRRPLVLCALQGLTQSEAAEVLGCGEATVRRRLAGAKDRLRARLGRRGVAAPAALAFSTPSVPPSWVEAASKLATAEAAKLAAPGVAKLASNGGWARRGVAALVGLGLAGGLVGYLATRPEKPRDPPKAEPPKAVAPVAAVPVAPKSEDEITFNGRVLGPDGRAVAGASILAHPRGQAARATASDAGGRFRLTYDVQAHRRARFLANDRVDGQPLPEMQNLVEEWPELVATAPGFGLGVASNAEGDEKVVRMVPDEPVEGRVLDLQGRPVAGATVRVRGLLAPRQGDLSAWIEAARASADRSEYSRVTSRFLSLLARHRDGLTAAYPTVLRPTSTDAEGRFRIEGIGRDRLAWVAIEKPGIESSLVAVANRPGVVPFVVPSTVAAQRKFLSNPSQDLAVYGSKFDHVAALGRAVEGRVVDRSTKSPVAGAVVSVDLASLVEWTEETRFRGVTDADGRYRVEGLPEGIVREFSAAPPEGQPYLGVRRDVDAGRGQAPPTVADFSIARGAWVEGRVLDGPAGNPVSFAQVHYNAFSDNPHLPKRPDRVPRGRGGHFTDQDGRYRLVAYPGRGLITVFAGHGGFAQGVGADEIPGRVMQYGRLAYPTVPEAVSPENINLVAEVNPPEGVGAIALDLPLRKARTREGRAVGPDGPVSSGLLGSGLSSWMSGPQEVKGAAIEVTNLSPGEVRRVVVRLDEKKLIGLAVLKAGEEGPFEVRLGPWASLTGRLVDADGKPRTRGLNVQLRDDEKLPVYAKGCEGYSNKPSTFLLDATGRFHAEALLPGQTYDVEILEGRLSIIDYAAKALTLQPGEARDLGDVPVKKP